MRLHTLPAWTTVLALVICFAPTSFGLTTKSAGSATQLASVFSAKSTLTTAIFEPLQYERKKKKDKGGSTSTMPEGGSALLYLGLAGVVCVGAVALTYRRKKYANETAAS
jgi:hypothetical protein